ncbi:hypothetical protein GFS31_15990 [Leptolyngbya sp. BL0902]|uniref:hypothetical protein n=1 Tax=Leptolyngbya sp. BL0902 TaxID=1115757 RepID=UPI0018E74C5B|nr:hypothetical protein [Leptolyngbya sp. BL0902]QQE64915.1 hypothetical protein GFS31_15990 [Leptolyngbya sp. BL0902]
MKVHTAYWPELAYSESSPSRAAEWLHRLWQLVISHVEISDEPRVWQSQSRDSAPAWNAYDPITGQSVHLVSEVELRRWLEDLHYQDQRIAETRQADLKLLWHC